MTTQASADGTAKRVSLERCLESVGWGVLLIAIGIIWLLPERDVPHGTWLIAAGLIMLGLNAVRFFSGLRTSGFSLVAGILALLAGSGEFIGVRVPLLPVALIVIGVYILLRPLRHRDSTSGTGDGWNCCGPCAPRE